MFNDEHWCLSTRNEGRARNCDLLDMSAVLIEKVSEHGPEVFNSCGKLAQFALGLLSGKVA